MTDRHPLDRVIAELEARGHHVRVIDVASQRFKVTCPAHSDRNPSLSLWRTENGAGVKCWAGCSTAAVLAKLGIRVSDLFIGPRQARERGKEIAAYDYVDHNGEVVATKVRFEGKDFKWRRPDPTARRGFRSGLDGYAPGLYNRPALTGAPVVFLTEGEKAVDRLASLGLTATCGSAGATTWKRDWSLTLAIAGCTELIILVDHDRPGEMFAERKTAPGIHEATSIAVKVVRLPGLADGEDVFDYLEAGHDLDDLLAVVAETPLWFPGASAQRRAEARKARRRDWMRKRRAEARSGADRSAPAAASGADTLDVVLELLASKPSSARALKRALAGSYTRLAVERALERGIRTGVLVVGGGGRHSCRKRYSVAAVPEYVGSRVTGQSTATVQRVALRDSQDRPVSAVFQANSTVPAICGPVACEPAANRSFLTGKSLPLNRRGHRVRDSERYRRGPKSGGARSRS